MQISLLVSTFFIDCYKLPINQDGMVNHRTKSTDLQALGIVNTGVKS